MKGITLSEIWRDINGYEGLYQVSNLGRIKRLKYFTQIRPNCKISMPERIKKQQVTNMGYYRVHLSKNATAIKYAVHRLVALAFIHNPNKKPQINHIDGNKRNNDVNNLEWCTCQENATHAKENGLRPKGEKIGRNKLKNADIPMIRKLKSSGIYAKDIAKKFNVHKSSIDKIITNITWSHIK